MEEGQVEKRVRGKGRGSGFFALGHDAWAKLLNVPTTNRLNLIITYLVLLAGTGSDHRLTKWSAKAVEEYTGLGKPRAKRSIEELIEAKLVKHTPSSSRLSPQYELPVVPAEAEPIFLPVQIVTGLAGETPMLRRIRETGDALLLQMLVDLYGLVQIDATYGVPIGNIREDTDKETPSARKVAEIGAHTVWAFKLGNMQWVAGDWTAPHRVKGATGKAAFSEFWERFALLKKIGAVWFEPWVFDGEALDAEPLFPVDPAVLYRHNSGDDEAKLTALAFETCRELIGDERSYLLDKHELDILAPLTGHHRTPALRGVLRMRVEPDTPGRRLAYRSRKMTIEQYTRAFSQVQEDAAVGEYSQPMRLNKIVERAALSRWHLMARVSSPLVQGSPCSSPQQVG